jgi:hypothetical protein
MSDAVEEARVAARTCGPCSLCCKVLGVEGIDKPIGRWCDHCRPGAGGCAIYASRPDDCREFSCGWLADASVGDHWQPTRARMVLQMIGNTSGANLLVHVDAGHSGAWRRSPYLDDLRRWSEKFGVVIVEGWRVAPLDSRLLEAA